MSDPAAVFIFILPKGKSRGANCSGVVVAPHVVLTAAHCTSPLVLQPLLGSDYNFFVFTGDDAASAAEQKAQGGVIEATEAFADPAFAPDESVGVVHDIGALVTAKELPAAPLPMRRAPIDPTFIGDHVRVIGFGQTAAADGTSIGVRRAATTTITGVDADRLWFSASGGVAGCEGDSGGPTLIDTNGVESVVGIHSRASSVRCDEDTYDTRVDADGPALVDPLIAMYDPDFQPPGDGSRDTTVDAGAMAPPSKAAGCAMDGATPRCGSGALSCLVLLVSSWRRRRRYAQR